MSNEQRDLTWLPVSDDLDALARPVLDAVREGAVPGALVARIDPDLADTQAFCDTYGVGLDESANCVVVLARRGDQATTAAVVVLAGERADINSVVRRHLGARKISFADQGETEATAGMTSGGITPIGLPAAWPLLIDERVAAAERVIVGGGVRGSKVAVSGAELAALPGAQVLALVRRDGDG